MSDRVCVVAGCGHGSGGGGERLLFWSRRACCKVRPAECSMLCDSNTPDSGAAAHAWLAPAIQDACRVPDHCCWSALDQGRGSAAGRYREAQAHGRRGAGAEQPLQHLAGLPQRAGVPARDGKLEQLLLQAVHMLLGLQ